MTGSLLLEGLANPVFSHVHLASVSAETIRRALQFKGDKTFSLDFGAKTLQAGDEELLELVSQMDYVFINKSIFERLFRVSVGKLETVNSGCDLIITAGKEGIYGKFGSAIVHQEIIAVDVVDTTGAGDAVAAAVITATEHRLPPTERIKAGISAAAIKIGSLGGSVGHATYSELFDN